MQSSFDFSPVSASSASNTDSSCLSPSPELPSADKNPRAVACGRRGGLKRAANYQRRKQRTEKAREGRARARTERAALAGRAELGVLHHPSQSYVAAAHEDLYRPLNIPNNGLAVSVSDLN